MKSYVEKSTVLIVDDLPENIDLLVAILSETYNIKVSTSSQKVMDLVKKGPPDLILLDIMMPDMDGYELCKKLKSDFVTKDIPVIFVTTKSDIEEEAKGFEVGAVDYITKPITAPIVLARVETHLKLYKQKQICAKKVEDRTKELFETRLELIKRLGLAAEYKDNETGMHVIRISNISYLLAKELGLSERDCNLIQNVSPMHDIGKIGIPDNVLLKPGRLDKEEWKIMQKHCEIGAKIIGDHKSDLLQMARVAALTHHEKWNGKGYPKGLKGKEIPIIGRIVAVADVFDALLSDRPYKKAWAIEDVIKLIKEEKGEHFDPEVVDAFFNVLDEITAIRENYSD